jgi:molybdate transport system regulatory protein
MKIWLITGAQAGVGKTTLLRGLTEILPDTICVKLGHGLRKTTGLKNYFTQTEDAMKFIEEQDGKREHCIVESNRLVGKIDADLIIFLDTLNGERRRDADKLRASAQIVLDKNVKEKDWEKPLKNLDLSDKEKTGVIKVFHEQREYLSSSRLILRTKLWFSRDGLLVFGEGLGRLLIGIDGKGSLSAAAKEEGISYRHAWGDIKRAEERLGFPLVTSSPGGAEGGGSMLTERGKLLLKGYEEIKRKVIKNSDKYFRELLQNIEDSDDTSE